MNAFKAHGCGCLLIFGPAAEFGAALGGANFVIWKFGIWFDKVSVNMNTPTTQCREHNINADSADKCAGTVRQYESGIITVSLCDYHHADLQDRMHAGSMR